MKLKGFQSDEVKYLMGLAKIQQREDEPIKIKLLIKDGEDLKKIKSDLEKRYQVEKMETFDLLKEKGKDTLMFADIPAKNLRRVLGREYVNNYGLPEELEVLSVIGPTPTKLRGFTCYDA